MSIVAAGAVSVAAQILKQGSYTLAERSEDNVKGVSLTASSDGKATLHMGPAQTVTYRTADGYDAGWVSDGLRALLDSPELQLSYLQHHMDHHEVSLARTLSDELAAISSEDLSRNYGGGAR